MKKTLFVLMTLAVAAVSCNKADVISVDRQAITFGEAFVDNATKADYSSGKTLSKFNVWGTVTGNNNTVALYSGAEVTGNVGDGKWTCNQTEYWIPSASYKFIALADATTTSNMPGKVSYSVDSKGDLLLASAEATTDNDGIPTGTAISNGVVNFTFTHLLSKVFFKFNYGVENNTRYAFNVTNVSLSGLTATGDYVFNDGWKNGSGTETLTFGTTAANVTSSASQNSTESHQILPLTQSLTATITYDVIYDGKTIMVGRTQSASVTNQTFSPNTVYCLNVSIPAPGQPIVFNVESIGGFGQTSEVTLQ